MKIFLFRKIFIFLRRLLIAWYQNGIHFTCQRCGHCCSGEPGFVYLTQSDITAISQYLNISEEEFLAIYTRKIDNGSFSYISLREKKDYACVFLSEVGCLINKVKPHQCSAYPIWSYLLEDKALFNNEKNACPGIGKGELITEKEIREILKKEREIILKTVKNTN